MQYKPIKKALLFAAGLGTRLYPLTKNRPKALVPAAGVPLLELTIRKLKYFGFEEIVINLHHFADQIVDFLDEKQNFGLNIYLSDERDLLLNTGGGLKKAAPWLKGAPFLIHNTDVITNLDLNAFYEAHLESEALATLATRKRDTSRHLLFDDERRLGGWRNNKTGETRYCRFAKDLHAQAFSGVHMLDSRIFDLLPPAKVFSIIDVYLEAGREHIVKSFPHDADFWFDVGKIPELERAAPFVNQLPLAD